ncbi:MAG: sedoheptulokinase, partial [Planctomycetota bacterium]|jgi:sugar (pentulose or hexulose) kinase
MHGVLLVNSELELQSNLITWRDQRTLASDKPGPINKTVEDLDPSLHERTGCRLHTGYGGATLHCLSKNNKLPESAVALTIADYVAGYLTGVVATEATHAASWGIFNLQTNMWDTQAVDKLGIPKKVLPTVNSTAKPLDTIQPAIAKQFGLGNNVQVCSPLGDNQAGIIGAAGFAGDAAVLNLGTGGQISIPQKGYKVLETLETRPMPFGGFILVGASLCGGWAYSCLQKFIQATVKEFSGVEVSDEEIYKRMNAIAAETSEGASGITVNTRFSGTRQNPNLRGSISGIGVDNFTVANLDRGFVEGMVRELAEMVSAAGIQGFTRIIASGNAVHRNPVVPDVIESIFGLPCYISTNREAAALGAAYAAAIGLGLITKDDVCPGLEKGK